MANKTVAEQIAETRKALFDEALLSEQYEELEALQGPDDPTFLEDMVNQFLKDMKLFFNQVGKELEKATLDAQVLGKVLHQIKGCTASIGAKQLYIICNQLREHVHSGEIERCREAFVQMDNQLALLDKRLGVYFELCREVQPEVTDGFPSPSSGGDSVANDGVKGEGK
ncbi:hypothetical protein QQ045_025730 [Rhodiola kirilowii]